MRLLILLLLVSSAAGCMMEEKHDYRPWGPDADKPSPTPYRTSGGVI